MCVNFLAHVYFADADPESIVGQLCGDFFRGSDLSRFSMPVQRAIRLHRSIDTYTDQHPLNLVARDLFKRPHRRFAGIIVDVIYDHFLALDWDRYCDLPLQEYTALVHRALVDHRDSLPVGLQRLAPFLQQHQLLLRNTQKSQIDLTLRRLSERRKAMQPLATAPDVLWQHEHALREIFDEFFPLLIQHVQEGT